MTTPAPTPAGFPDHPHPAQLLQDARAGIERRAARLLTALAVLAVLSGLGVLALILLSNLGWQAVQQLLTSLELQAELDLPAERTLSDLIPGWVLPTLLALSLLASAIQIWAILRARAVIGAVRDQTLNPSADHAETLISAARTVRPWIALGQWTPIIWTVFGLAWLPITFALIGRIDPVVSATAGLDAFSIGFGVFSILIPSLPIIILTWLILAAVRRWLDAVVARAQGGLNPVTPASRSAEGWLLFVLIILILSTVSLVISAVPLLLLPVLFTTLAVSDPSFSDLASIGLTPADLRVFFSVLAGLLVFSGAVYGLLTAMMAWSRGLAANVATVLDAPLSRPPAAMNDWNAVPDTQDLWKGPVTVVPPRNQG